MAGEDGTFPIECVDVGDYVCVAYNQRDVIRTCAGRVANIRAVGRVREIQSEEGEIIVRFDVSKPRLVRVLRIDQYTPMPPELPIDELLEEVND